MSIVNRLKAAAEEHGPKLVDSAKKAAAEHGPKVQRAAADAVQKHSPKIQEGIDKAARLADERTGGKHSDRIHAATGKLHEGVDKLDATARKSNTHEDVDLSADEPKATDRPDSV